MKASRLSIMAILILLSTFSSMAQNGSQQMVVRISEIEVYPNALRKYLSILEVEAKASVEKEPGVISIFPMVVENDSTQIRILEIYASKEAYQKHIESSHFKHYKSSTLEMVKSLKLIDMKAVDRQTMLEIFKKLR